MIIESAISGASTRCSVSVLVPDRRAHEDTADRAFKTMPNT